MENLLKQEIANLKNRLQEIEKEARKHIKDVEIAKAITSKFEKRNFEKILIVQMPVCNNCVWEITQHCFTSKEVISFENDQELQEKFSDFFLVIETTDKHLRAVSDDIRKIINDSNDVENFNLFILIPNNDF